MTDEKLDKIFEAEREAQVIIDEANEKRKEILADGETVISSLKNLSGENRKKFKKETLSKVNDDYNKKYEEILESTQKEISIQKDNLKEKIDEYRIQITKEILDRWQ